MITSGKVAASSLCSWCHEEHLDAVHPGRLLDDIIVRTMVSERCAKCAEETSTLNRFFHACGITCGPTKKHVRADIAVPVPLSVDFQAVAVNAAFDSKYATYLGVARKVEKHCNDPKYLTIAQRSVYPQALCDGFNNTAFALPPTLSDRLRQLGWWHLLMAGWHSFCVHNYRQVHKAFAYGKFLFPDLEITTPPDFAWKAGEQWHDFTGAQAVRMPNTFFEGFAFGMQPDIGKSRQVRMIAIIGALVHLWRLWVNMRKAFVSKHTYIAHITTKGRVQDIAPTQASVNGHGPTHRPRCASEPC